MRTLHLTPMRGALVVLLVGSAILFLIGSTIERNHRHHETTVPAAASTEGTGGEGSGSSSEATPTHSEKGHGETGAKILGVNTESLALSIIAVVLSVLLAAAALIAFGRWSRFVVVAVIGFGLVFAAGDAREVVHQVNDSNSGLAALAAILIALHLAVSALAALLLRHRRPMGTPIADPA